MVVKKEQIIEEIRNYHIQSMLDKWFVLGQIDVLLRTTKSQKEIENIKRKTKYYEILSWNQGSA